MPRRATPKSKKRDWRWYASLALNGAVVLSMVVGTFLIFAPPTPRSAAPVIETPTLAPITPIPVNASPTVAPTPVPPTPTPKISA
jgi:hypothetical protein